MARSALPTWIRHFAIFLCKYLEVDEIWAFCYAKAKNVPVEKAGQFGYGDVWTFTAIDAETKLIPSYMVGPRDGGTATEFMQDLAGRLAYRPQITSDGLKVYIGAVEDAFSGDVDFGMLHKIYGAAPSGPETRYSPAECIGAEKRCMDVPRFGGQLRVWDSLHLLLGLFPAPGSYGNAKRAPVGVHSRRPDFASRTAWD